MSPAPLAPPSAAAAAISAPEPSGPSAPRVATDSVFATGRRVASAPRRPVQRLIRRPARGPLRSATAALGSLGLAASLAVGGLAAAGPSAAAAQEVTTRPASGSFTLTGSGYGHGRGMSQWGAYGAAAAGLTWQQIIAFYYPGTALHSIADSQMRVLISADTDGDTMVKPAAGLSAVVGRTAVTMPTGAGYTAWRAKRYANGITVQYRDRAGAWRGWRGFTMRSGVLVFRTSSGIVRLVLPSGTSQDVRGSVYSTISGSKVITVVNSTMEAYLRSVVPAEMPASWHVRALSAQAVAARTYAASYRQRQRAKGASWDICDSISCQVYKGVARYTASGTRVPGEFARTDAAITATKGRVLRVTKSSTSAFAFAEFSASNGGYTVAGGPFYQVAKRDPYDGRLANPNTAWSSKVAVTTLEKTYGLGRLIDVRILDRDGNGVFGGRVDEVQLTGSTRAVTLTGTRLRQDLKLRSEMFKVTQTPVAPAS